MLARSHPAPLRLASPILPDISADSSIFPGDDFRDNFLRDELVRSWLVPEDAQAAQLPPTAHNVQRAFGYHEDGNMPGGGRSSESEFLMRFILVPTVAFGRYAMGYVFQDGTAHERMWDKYVDSDESSPHRRLISHRFIIDAKRFGEVKISRVYSDGSTVLACVQFARGHGRVHTRGVVTAPTSGGGDGRTVVRKFAMRRRCGFCEMRRSFCHCGEQSRSRFFGFGQQFAVSPGDVLPWLGCSAGAGKQIDFVTHHNEHWKSMIVDAGRFFTGKEVPGMDSMKVQFAATIPSAFFDPRIDVTIGEVNRALPPPEDAKKLLKKEPSLDRPAPPSPKRQRLDPDDKSSSGGSTSCEYCGKMFKHLCHKDAHVSTVHMKERLFKCPVCQRGFSTRSNLKRHQTMVHEQIRRFSCDMCNFACHEAFDLRRHQKRMHSK